MSSSTCKQDAPNIVQQILHTAPYKWLTPNHNGGK